MVQIVMDSLLLQIMDNLPSQIMDNLSLIMANLPNQIITNKTSVMDNQHHFKNKTMSINQIKSNKI